MTEQQARAEILAKVKEYCDTYHKKKEYETGDRIPYASRVYDSDEMTNLVDSALEFWLTAGRYTAKFEKEFANYLGVRFCSLVNSGSSANLLAFAALTSPLLGDRRVFRGDEVITVAAGFPTTVTPVIQYGAVPVFVDVTIPQYNIDVTKLEDALSEKTKAVMIAHTLGNPFDLKAVRAFCDKHDLWLVEDNCDALGSKYTLDGKTYSHDLIVNKALEFIRENKDKPFFCYMPVTIPHAAMQVPEPYMTPWREKYPEFENVLGRYSYNTVVRNPVAAFPAMVTRLDDTVGQVLDLLKELGLEEDTIVIFTSDNGPHHEGGHRPDFFNSSGAVRGLKRDLYDGGIREPFVIQWKGKIQPGTVTDHVAAFWDILPTFAQLAGAKTPDNIDGISLVPTLLGDPDNQKSHEYLYWEFHEMGGKRAVRFGDFKAVQNDMNKKPRGKIEIYNIVEDPKELNNLADQRPDLVQKARKILNSARTSNPIWNWK